MKIMNYIIPYRCDYKELKKYKDVFDTYEGVDVLRQTIMCYLSTKTTDEILDLEMKLKIEIEEVNKSSISASAIPIITFILGALSYFAKKDVSAIIIYIIGLIIIGVIYAIYTISISNHYKYYIFYNEIIKRYKKDNNIE